MRRFSLPATAVALMIAGGIWAAAKGGWFSSGPAALATASSAAAPTGNNPAAEGPTLLLRYTVVDLPAKFLTVRLLTYQASPVNGAALLTEARGLSPSGGKLEEFDLSAPLGREVQFEKIQDYEYADGWFWDQENDVGKAKDSNKETKQLGTWIGTTVSGSKTDGFELAWRIRHHFAAPEPRVWPISLEKSTADPERGIQMENFHEAGGNGRCGNLRENEPRLLFIQHLPPSALPEASPEPRTLLLFVTLNPS